MTSYTVADGGLRLDVFLAAQSVELSRSRVQKLIDEGNVTVNGTVRKANYKLATGDVVAFDEPEPQPLDIVAENIPLNILYEDQDVIVINKKRGMVTHPANGNYTGTLVNALLYHTSDLSGINGVLRPGIVHRLDKDTSGVMVVAKTNLAHLSLARQIQDKTATRTYLAIVSGNIREASGVIRGAIGRHKTDRQKMAVTPDGKPAVTHFKVLERFGNYTFIECQLETGRTHQIRVHMAYIGNPVLADPKYSRSKDKVPISGQALHSHTLKFLHPLTEKEMQFTAPLPADMEYLLDLLRKRTKH